jgi:hypothetical protein
MDSSSVAPTSWQRAHYHLPLLLGVEDLNPGSSQAQIEQLVEA